MALAFGKRRQTPETATLRAVIHVLTLRGYFWMEPRMIRRYDANQLRQLAQQRDLRGLAFRMNTGGASDRNDQFVMFGVPGHPDIVVLQLSADRRSLRWIGIEVKTADGKLNENQERIHALVNGLTPERPSIHVIRRVEDLEGVI